MLARPLSSLTEFCLPFAPLGSGHRVSTGRIRPSTPTKPVAAAPAAPNASRIDIFTGFSYLAPSDTVNVPGAGPNGSSLPVSYSAVNTGAIGSVAYYFDKFVGLQFEMGAHPDGNNDGFYTYQGGLIRRYPVIPELPHSSMPLAEPLKSEARTSSLTPTALL